jgi:hypothetical protein
MNTDARHRFGATAFTIVGGLLIWLADFLFIYVFAALACAQGFATATLAGLRVVPLAAMFASLLAVAATSVLVQRVRRNMQSADEQERFIGFVALATSAIALIALILLALPPLFVATCAD